MPFTALVGQDAMKTALVLNAINPNIGGVLIRGQRGTAKSTAVRALARLLPEIDVIAGCRYRCDPATPGELVRRLPHSLSATAAMHRSSAGASGSWSCPINASEDRVVGTIDTEAAIKYGERRFEPGLLAEANRGILYVDEVNLLDDHIVDVLLDAAAMGWNVVEREGISFAHPSRFILVGTMNPEEGELRPQLLDRFGLCVDITGLRDVDERVRIVERDARRSVDGAGLDLEFEGSEEHLRSVIVEARRLLPRTEITQTINWFIALVCIDAGALGHRADIVVSSAARTVRAWEEADRVVRMREAQDVAEPTPTPTQPSASWSRPPTRRSPPSSPSRTGGARARTASRRAAGATAERAKERFEEIAQEAEAATISDQSEEAGDQPPDDSGSGEEGESAGQVQGSEQATQAVTRHSAEQLFEGELFPVRKIALPRDRRTRSTTGKRSSSQSSDKRGRYVRATQTEKTTDIAFDATMRAAAPHQNRRRAEATAETGGPGAAPGASGPASEGPAPAHGHADRVRRRRQRIDGRRAAHAGDQGRRALAAPRRISAPGQGLARRVLRPVRADRAPADIVGRPRGTASAAADRRRDDAADARARGRAPDRPHRASARSRASIRCSCSSATGEATSRSSARSRSSRRSVSPSSSVRMACTCWSSTRRATTRAVRCRGSGSHSRPPLFGGYGFNACRDLADRSGGEYLGLFDLSQGAILEGVEKSLRGRMAQ